MNKQEATAHFIDSLANCAISEVATDHDGEDDVTWWTCDIEDVNTGHCGSAQFPEHWPEVVATW